jgi:TolB-like protein
MGPSLPDKPSLVVLPFANLSGTTENDYLVDGVITDIISSLSRLSGLFVIAAATSFRFKGQAVDLADVGRQLGVRYAVEGSVQQAGPRLRVTVQLVEAETGRTIWSERFDGTTEDVFDLQDDIAARVAGAVEPNLLLAEAGRLQNKPTEDMAAYDLVLRAMPHILKVPTLEDFRKGVALLDQAIARDPDYAVAKAWKVRAYLIARGRASDHVGRVPRNRTARPVACGRGAQRPVGDDVRRPWPTRCRAGDRRKAPRPSGVARGYVPNSAVIQTAAGFPLAYLGAYDEAIEAFGRGLRLDPWAKWRSIAGWGPASATCSRGGSKPAWK